MLLVKKSQLEQQKAVKLFHSNPRLPLPPYSGRATTTKVTVTPAAARKGYSDSSITAFDALKLPV